MLFLAAFCLASFSAAISAGVGSSSLMLTDFELIADAGLGAGVAALDFGAGVCTLGIVAGVVALDFVAGVVALDFVVGVVGLDF